MVEPVNLTVGLWMVAGGETDVDVKLLAESFSDSRGELWTLVDNYIFGKAVEMEDLFQQDFGGFEGSWQFG